MMVEYGWVKNIQYKRKINQVPMLPFPDKTICPVFWMGVMINTVKAGPKDQAFSIIQGGKIRNLSYAQILRKLKNWVEMVSYQILHVLIEKRRSYICLSKLHRDTINKNLG